MQCIRVFLMIHHIIDKRTQYRKAISDDLIQRLPVFVQLKLVTGAQGQQALKTSINRKLVPLSQQPYDRPQKLRLQLLWIITDTHGCQGSNILLTNWLNQHLVMQGFNDVISEELFVAFVQRGFAGIGFSWASLVFPTAFD